MDEKKLESEDAWARFRIMCADFRNAHRGKGKKAIKPQELIPLSFDKKKEEEKFTPMSNKEMKQMFGAKFKKLNGN